MKYIKQITAIIALLVTFSCSNKNERTPYSITKALVGIEINEKVTIVEFKDEWGSVTGDGQSLIVFNIQPSQILSIKNSCINKHFKKLPIEEQLPDNLIYNYINKVDTCGLYWLEVDKKDYRSYCIAVLSEKKHELVIYNVIY